jgi:hypothetical protein
MKEHFSEYFAFPEGSKENKNRPLFISKAVFDGTS